MTREEMERYLEAYESGDPMTDFFDDSLIYNWLYQFVRKALSASTEE